MANADAIDLLAPPVESSFDLQSLLHISLSQLFIESINLNLQIESGKSSSVRVNQRPLLMLRFIRQQVNNRIELILKYNELFHRIGHRQNTPIEDALLEKCCQSCLELPTLIFLYCRPTRTVIIELKLSLSGRQ